MKKLFLFSTVIVVLSTYAQQKEGLLTKANQQLLAQADQAYTQHAYSQAYGSYQLLAPTNAHAAFRLGYMLLHGFGTPKDLPAAIQWLTRASDANDADAQYWLGECYATGTGVIRDARAAAVLFTKAAAQDQPQAQFAL